MLPEVTQKDLFSAEDRDEIIKEFAEEFIRTYPDEVSSMKEATEALGEAIKSHMTVLGILPMLLASSVAIFRIKYKLTQTEEWFTLLRTVEPNVSGRKTQTAYSEKLKKK